MRSFLTLIGVILGTLAVVVMVTMIEALKVMVWEGIKSLGYDGVMFVSPAHPGDPIERKKRRVLPRPRRARRRTGSPSGAE